MQTPVTSAQTGIDPPSASTEEILTTYTERAPTQISPFEEQLTGTKFSPSLDEGKEEQGKIPPKSSESELITVDPIGQKEATPSLDTHQTQLDTASETSGRHQHVEYFPTDISEVEHHFDSAGAEVQTHPQTAAFSDVFELNETSHDACGDTSEVECTKSELPNVSRPRQLSVKG